MMRFILLTFPHIEISALRCAGGVDRIKQINLSIVIPSINKDRLLTCGATLFHGFEAVRFAICLHISFPLRRITSPILRFPIRESVPVSPWRSICCPTFHAHLSAVMHSLDRVHDSLISASTVCLFYMLLIIARIPCLVKRFAKFFRNLFRNMIPVLTSAVFAVIMEMCNPVYAK